MEGIVISLITWLVGIAAVVLFLYLLSRHNLWIRKYGLTLLLLFWFLGFTIYFIGYFFGSEKSGYRLFHSVSSLFSAIFSSGRIMTMEIDLKETGRFAEYEIYQAACETVVFSAMLLLAATLLANIGGGIIGRIRLIFLRTIGTRQNVYLVYGLRHETVYLAGDIHRRYPKATILLLHDRSEDNQEESRKILENEFFQYGAAKLFFTPEKTLPFLMCIVKKCRKQTFLLLMDSDYGKNTAILEKLDLLSLKQADPKLHLYVMCEKGISECLARDGSFREWDIHWISYGELAARQALMLPDFLDICPICDCIHGRAERDLKLVVAGYSETAEELCRYLSSCVQTVGLTVSIYLFDKDIQQKTAYFRISNPELSKAVSFIPMDFEVNSQEFYEYFRKEQDVPDAVFFAGGDRKKNALYAFRFREILQRYTDKDVPVFVQKESKMEEHLAFEISGIHSFGCIEQLYSYDILISEELDTMAKAVHLYYKKFYGEEGDMELLWKQASLYDKMSSRALAIHIPWKLKCAGFQKAAGLYDGTYERALEADSELAENLAIGEHLRWSAYLFADGWKTGKPEDLPPGRNKDEGRKLHACLVPWEELAKVEQYYGCDYRYLDRHLIGALAQILQYTGYTIQKRKEG